MQALNCYKRGSACPLTIGTLSQAFNLSTHPDSACILVGLGEKRLEASWRRCSRRPEGGKRPHPLAWEQAKGWHQVSLTSGFSSRARNPVRCDSMRVWFCP
jgi:hypothetical protein